MMIGARTAAWAKSGPTAKDYVQDGLIAMWDGIENAGWGVHDPNATVWKDLVGSYDIQLIAETYVWRKDQLESVHLQKGVQQNSGSVSISRLGINRGSYTVEAVCVPITITPSIETGSSFGYIGSSDEFWNTGTGSESFYSDKSVALGNQFTSNWGRNKNFDYISKHSICSDSVIIPNPGEPSLIRNESGLFVFLNYASQSYIGNPEGRMRILHVKNQTLALKNLRLYDGVIETETRATNYAIDNARFNLP